MRWIRGFRGALVSLLAGILLFLGAAALISVFEDQGAALVANGVEVPAVVTDVNQGARTEDWMKVRFFIAGDEREHTLPLNGDHAVGDRITVVYDRFHHENVTVAGVPYESPYAFFAIIPMLGSLALVVLAGLLAVGAIRDAVTARRVGRPGRHRARAPGGDGGHSR
ncbi:hypothetical protein [Actinokineospora terrae]|uniref:hypothetical protein n=1 Tax=Actinokineospora terrae TaxID=155974 RepID=UPI001160CAC0|nr:hypothetical protein [Actinokineospora terrae]